MPTLSASSYVVLGLLLLATVGAWNGTLRSNARRARVCAWMGGAYFAGAVARLAIGVTIASLAILGLGFAAVVLDIRDQRRSQLEVDRMRDLADASVEGLLVCDGETIVSAPPGQPHNRHR